jgi:virulence-associated protein VapD
MTYKNDFYRFVRENRRAFNAVMPINIDTLEDEDIRILCNHATFKAGEPYYKESGGKIDPAIIDGVRVFFNRHGTDSPKAIAKAFSWYEKGALNVSSLKDALFNQPSFSPRIENYLKNKRQENYRKAFSDIQKSIVNLGDEIKKAVEIMKSPEPLSSKPMALQIRAQMKKISAALERCDKCGRGGLGWAHKVGIPLEKSSRSISQMYLSKLPQLERAVSKVEVVLASQGIKSSVSTQINRRQFLWRHDIQMAKDELKSQAKNKHKQQEDHYAIR